MPDPLSPRGAIARRKTGVLPNALCARLAIVASITAFFLVPRLARAEDGCGPLEATQAVVAAWGGGPLTQLGGDLADGLRAANFPAADAVYGAPVIVDRAAWRTGGALARSGAGAMSFRLKATGRAPLKDRMAASALS
ncbi:MAG: hypothetical protein ABSF67_03795 [Roseiarcus sp.]|jgi:hypothetical protein